MHPMHKAYVPSIATLLFLFYFLFTLYYHNPNIANTDSSPKADTATPSHVIYPHTKQDMP